MTNEVDIEAELSLKQMTSNFGVRGYLIMNENGVPLKSSDAGFNSYSSVSQLVKKINKLIKLDADDELLVLRLRTKKGEIIVTQDENFSLVVYQDPNYVEPVAAPVVAEVKAE